MRKYYWYLSAFLRKHGLLLGVTLVFAVIFFSLLIPYVITRITPKPKFYIGMVGNYQPQSLPKNIRNLISTGLTTVEEDGSISSGLATRWSVEDEGKTYRFLINTKLFWQDGRPLTPKDITYNFSDVETITTDSDIVFKLPDIYVPFPVTVTQPILRFQTEPYLFFFRRERIIGLGDYEVISFKKTGQRLQEITIDGPEDRRIYRFYLTENDLINAFKKGEVDYLTDLSDPHELSNWNSVNIYERYHPERYLAVFFDLNKPIFQKNIRQSLSYTLEKPSDETRAIGPINPNSWAYLPGGKTYDLDYERAIERMFSALPEEPLQFELATTPAFEDKAEIIKQTWEDFGAKAKEECKTSKQVASADRTKCDHLDIQVSVRISNFPDTTSFDAMLIGSESPPDPDQYYLWHSEQSTNFSHYKNTRIDSLLEKGRQTIDKQERKEIYQEFQQFLLEDAPVIFLEHLISYDIERK